MKIQSVSRAVNSAPRRQGDVTLRLNSIRASLRKYGMAVVDLDNPVDSEAVSRLTKVHGEENIRLEYSNRVKLTIEGFGGE